MELTLSNNCVIHTDLSTPDGQCLYTISTPSHLSRRTTTIIKYAQDEDGRSTGQSAELARIHWHYLGSSRLIYDGKIMEFDKFMPYKGLLRRYVHETSRQSLE